MTNLIWNASEWSLVRPRTSHSSGTLCTCKSDFSSTSQSAILDVKCRFATVFHFWAMVFAWPASQWFFIAQHDFLISFGGYKCVPANLICVELGALQLVIPHLTYNGPRIFLHCGFPQTISQSDSTHTLPHPLRSGPRCEYFTCQSVG